MRQISLPLFLLPALVSSFAPVGGPQNAVPKAPILPPTNPQIEYRSSLLPHPSQAVSAPSKPIHTQPSQTEEEIRESLARLGWIPLSTIIPDLYATETSQSIEVSGPVQTPAPEQGLAHLYHLWTGEPSNHESKDGQEGEKGSDLELRQIPGVGGGLGPPVTQNPLQVSPITTVYIGTAQVVYTQLFSATLVPFPSASVGSVGLGTLTGQVGVVKTQAANAANGRMKRGMEVGAVIGVAGAVGWGLF
ncbi:hypothetical protein MMC25_002640 [Agyrium rufum]|nr:hypothetical protein [Agyrium rufum]